MTETHTQQSGTALGIVNSSSELKRFSEQKGGGSEQAEDRGRMMLCQEAICTPVTSLHIYNRSGSVARYSAARC